MRQSERLLAHALSSRLDLDAVSHKYGLRNAEASGVSRHNLTTKAQSTNCIEEEGAAGGVEGPQNVIAFMGRSTKRSHDPHRQPAGAEPVQSCYQIVCRDSDRSGQRLRGADAG